MKSWLRMIAIFTIVTLLPVIPFLVLGEDFEGRLSEWMRQREGTAWVSLATITLLALDIVLPVPSSVVCTISGSRLGWLAGGLAGGVGLTAGALLGYGCAYWLGGVWARRQTDRDDWQQATRWLERWGPLALVLTRPIPLIAEATVLLAGVYRMKPLTFLVPVATVNLCLATAYTVLGVWAQAQGWLPTAIGLSAALPLIPLWWMRRWWKADSRTADQSD